MITPAILTLEIEEFDSIINNALEKALSCLSDAERFELINDLTELLDIFLQDKASPTQSIGVSDGSSKHSNGASPGVLNPQLNIIKCNNIADKHTLLLKALKKLLGQRGRGNIVIGQINTTAGDLEGNSKKIVIKNQAEETAGIEMLQLADGSFLSSDDINSRHDCLC